MTKTEKASLAATTAIAHAEAWSNHDWDTARAMLAPDVHVTTTTTQPILPPVDLTGIDNYMEGLIHFAQGVEPGSANVISSIGDEHNSIVLMTVKAAFSPEGPKATLALARLALFDENNKMKAEQVIVFVLSE